MQRMPSVGSTHPAARRAGRVGRLAVAAVVSALLVLAVTATPAVAGGSWFETTRPRYEPGDTVTMIGYTGGGQLGWIEDGPFYGYLRVTPPDGDAQSWPVVAPTDLPVGRLQLDEGGRGWMRLRAMVIFRLPSDLAPGAYDFVYCNDPCTTGLGDLVGGMVYVGVSPPQADGSVTPTTVRTSTTVSETTTTRDAPVSTAPSTDAVVTSDSSTRAGDDRASWAVGAVVVAALAAGIALTLRRGRPGSGSR